MLRSVVTAPLLKVKSKLFLKNFPGRTISSNSQAVMCLCAKKKNKHLQKCLLYLLLECRKESERVTAKAKGGK